MNVLFTANSKDVKINYNIELALITQNIINRLFSYKPISSSDVPLSLLDGQSFNLRSIVEESHLVEHVGVLKEALFETDDDELAALEIFLDHEANVLRVMQVQSRVNLIEDVERGRLVSQQCQDQGQCQK